MDLIPDFIRRRHEKWLSSTAPLLKPICEETYGIMIYQEQVMQAAQILAGYTSEGRIFARYDGQEESGGHAGAPEAFAEGCAKLNELGRKSQ